MEKLIKFFNYDENTGKVVLHPPFMGSDAWSLRSDEGQLLVSVDQFLEVGDVFLEDGNYILNLVELDEFVCFVIKFGIKGRQIIVEEVSCRNSYKKSFFSVMPDRGIYIL
jgi:hypothetical protein